MLAASSIRLLQLLVLASDGDTHLTYCGQRQESLGARLSRRRRCPDSCFLRR